MSVEERIQKLEQMNQRLLDQNQQLNKKLKSITDKIDTKNPPGGDPDALGTQPTTGSAVGGGDLMARPTGPAAGGGGGGGGAAGGDVNALRVEPSTSTAVGGGDLITFDEKDDRGIKMNTRFGRRFVNNGLWFESPNKNFQIHIGGRTQFDATCSNAGNSVQFGPRGIGKLRDGVDPRRTRVRLEGAMYEQMLYVMEWDFANTAVFNQANAAANSRWGSNGAVDEHGQHPRGKRSRAHGPVDRFPEDPHHRQPPDRQPEGAVRLRAAREQPLPELHGTLVQQ